MRCNGLTGILEVIDFDSAECGGTGGGGGGGEQQCTNPETGYVISEGGFTCVGTTLKQCNAGTLEVVELNSPECGGTAPPDEPPIGQRPCTNPAGQHNAARCDGYTLKRCRDGTWITIEENSAQCGYGTTPPPEGNAPCTNPAGTHGSYYCDGTTKKQCNNGTWAAIEYESADCGAGEEPPEDEEPPVGGTGCTGPEGIHGQYICDGTTLKKCHYGQWLTVQANAPQCTTVTPPPGNGGGDGDEDTGLDLGDLLEGDITIPYLNVTIPKKQAALIAGAGVMFVVGLMIARR